MSSPLICNFSIYSCKIEELKKKVGRKLMGTTNEVKIMRTIDSLYRFDIAYHFPHELETKMSSICHRFGGCNTDDHDLYSVALRFRLLRQQGFCVSSDVFQKFKNDEGRFDLELAKDAAGLMSLYEAAQFAHPGEHILDEAKIFANAHLQALAPFVEESQARQVEHVLEHPFHMSLPRIEARRYIEIFRDGHEIDRDMLDLAILDFNHVQSIHQRELQEFSRWWEELAVTKEMALTRNQPILWFMLSSLALAEPQFSKCRIELAKLIALIFVIDDLYDACGELKDMALFSEAVNSWDPTSVEQLPNYMKLCFSAILDVVENGIGFLALKPQHCINMLDHSKTMWRSLGKAYLQEARWLMRMEESPTADGYLNNAITTSGLILFLTHAYFLLGGQHLSTMNPLNATPSLIHHSATIFRLWDHLDTSQKERDTGHDASYLEFYMKEHNASEECARMEVMNLIRNVWKKLNRASLQNERGYHDFLPAFVTLVLNYARIGQLLYVYSKDHQTIKEHVRTMLMEKIHV